MPSPIIDKFKERNKIKNIAFHMPGHKGKSKFVPNDLFSFDITEIEGFDNLHNPTDIIKESEKYCAKLFGADKTFYLVNGTTSGIMASITAICKPKDKILVARNCHKSIYNGIILSGAIPVYVMSDKTFFKTGGTIQAENVKKALCENEDIKAMIMTNPDYEGLCSDVKEIAKILHERNIPLIVDEAHGAHLKFSEKFPSDALSLGADISVQSFHKTLPVLTQSSVLHVKSKLIDYDKLAKTISMYTSTSPSYIFMAVLDYCQNMLSEKSEYLFDAYTKNLEYFYEKTKALKNLKILTKDKIKEKTKAYDNDFGKIICLIDNKFIFKVENYLKRYYNINIEMKGENHILFMTSICDEREDFDLLIDALYEIDEKITVPYKFPENSEKTEDIIPVCVISPASAFHSEMEEIPFCDSIGLISGEFIIPYPPGIPLLAPGELITAQIVEKVKNIKQTNTEIIGCCDNNLENIKVIF